MTVCSNQAGKVFLRVFFAFLASESPNGGSDKRKRKQKDKEREQLPGTDLHDLLSVI